MKFSLKEAIRHLKSFLTLSVSTLKDTIWKLAKKRLFIYYNIVKWCGSKLPQLGSTFLLFKSSLASM